MRAGPLLLRAAALAAALAGAAARGQTITTVAGNGDHASSPDGSPAATSALLLAQNNAANVVFDADGNLVFSEGGACRVRRISRKTGLLETLAGSGRCGFAGDGGPATQARLNAPAEVAFDRQGNLYVADAENNVVRRVDAKTGLIATIAGTRKRTFNGDGIGTAVALGRPAGLTFDRDRRLVIADTANSRLRRLDPKTLEVETIAGRNELNFTGGDAFATGFAWPASPRFGPDGALYFAAPGNNRILRLDPKTRQISAFAGNGLDGSAGDGGPAAAAALSQPAAIAIDRAGNVFVCDTMNHAIRRVDAKTGVITRVAGTGRPGIWGDDGPAEKAGLNNPLGLGLDGAGNLYVVDATNGRIRRIEGVAAR